MNKSTRVAESRSEEQAVERRQFSIPWAFIAALILLASLPYLPWISSYFVADDWPLLARTQFSWREVPQWFWSGRGNWYRPLSELYSAACARLFGLHSLGYHVMSILLYVIATALVGLSGWLLAEDRRLAGLAALVFALHSCHSTVVMWIVSVNELLAGVFGFGSMACYILYRKKNRLWMLFVALIGCMLAIAAKETALFLPLAFAIYDVVFYAYVTGTRFHWKVLLPSLFLLLVVGIHTLFHLPRAASSITLDVGRWARNALLYLSTLTLTTPEAYSAVTMTSFSLAVEQLAALGLFILALVMLLTGRRATRRTRSTRDRRRSLSLGFCLVMVFVALFPSIFVFAERTAFLSSAFVSLTLSCLFVQAWDQAAKRRFGFRTLVLAGLVLWMSAQAITLVRRNYWWGQAGALSKAVMEQLGEQIDGLSSDTQVWLLGLPDHLENAYVFRNAFPKAARVLGYEQTVRAVLDVELDGLSEQERVEIERQLLASSRVFVLWYEGGWLGTSPAK